MSESMSVEIPRTWGDYFTTILPAIPFKPPPSKPSSSTGPWLAQERPTPKHTPRFVRVDSTIPTRLLDGLHRGLTSKDLLSQPIDHLAKRWLDFCLDEQAWADLNMTVETTVQLSFINLLRPIKPLLSKVYATAGQEIDLFTQEESTLQYSQKGDGTLALYARPTGCEPEAPYQRLPLMALEFKKLKVILRYAKGLVQDRPLSVTGQFKGHRAILIKHALQLRISGARYGLISAGYCGCYTELVELPDYGGVALLISPLFMFTSSVIPTSLAPGWTTEEIRGIALSPIFAVIAAMSCAGKPGFEVDSTGVEVTMPDPTASDQESEPLDEASESSPDTDDESVSDFYSDEGGDQDDDSDQDEGSGSGGGDHDENIDVDEYSDNGVDDDQGEWEGEESCDDDEKPAAGKKRQHKQQGGRQQRHGGPGDKAVKVAPSGTSRRMEEKMREKAKQLKDQLGAALTEHQITISFSEPSHSRVPVPYHRLRFISSPSTSHFSIPVPSPLIRHISESTSSPPNYGPRDAISRVVLSERILATSNSSAWRGTAKLVYPPNSIPVVVKFMQGEALSMARREIEIYETAHIKDVMPCYYGTWMVNGTAGVAMVMEDIGHSLEVSGGDLSEQDSKKLLSALRKLHTNGIYHRDFCPRNVGRRNDGTFCIFDYGLATFHKCPGKRCPELREGLCEFK